MCLTAGAEDCDAVISMTAECSNQTNERSCAWVMASVVLYTCPCSHCCNLYQRTATLAQLRLTTASSFLFTVTRQQSPFHRHQVNLTVLHVARLSCKSSFSYAELLLLADNKWRRDTTWLRTQCVALGRVVWPRLYLNQWRLTTMTLLWLRGPGVQHPFAFMAIGRICTKPGRNAGYPGNSHTVANVLYRVGQNLRQHLKY